MSRLTTHVIDTARGCPASGIRLELLNADGQRVAAAVTNADGRTDAPLASGEIGGVYRLIVYAGDYFRANGVPLTDPPFLDQVVIRFGVDPKRGNYHVPLLLSPYGYSTYRGS